MSEETVKEEAAEASFTPGPWFANRGAVIIESGAWVAQTSDPHGGGAMT
jgi:hypothetical protein